MPTFLRLACKLRSMLRKNSRFSSYVAVRLKGCANSLQVQGAANHFAGASIVPSTPSAALAGITMSVEHLPITKSCISNITCKHMFVLTPCWGTGALLGYWGLSGVEVLCRVYLACILSVPNSTCVLGTCIPL